VVLGVLIRAVFRDRSLVCLKVDLWVIRAMFLSGQLAFLIDVRLLVVKWQHVDQMCVETALVDWERVGVIVRLPVVKW